ncbi:MAG TPA: nitronate monooxygenase family protein [Vicinamibacteria bacterium]|nr:nitronate monooxygenase family protein [Vicinamibacteria bacterium]
MLRTNLCDLLGIEHPVVLAPMGPDISGPELVAAVSEAGGLGILQSQLSPPGHLREQIRRIRERTAKPFAVSFLVHFPHEDAVRICLEEGVRAVSFFWGPPSPLIETIHRAGSLVIHQVGSVEAARGAAAAGVDVVIAQGVEAGGHVEGEVSTMALVPRVVDSIAPTPVAAAGGIADGRGLAAALALGAQAAVLGTRFLVTPESHAHPFYKQQVLAATEADTVRTTLFGHGWPDAPHRTLRTAFVEEWLGREARGSESRPDEPVVGEARIAGHTFPLLRFMGFPPNAEATGDIASMSLLAGQSAGLVSELIPAATVVRELVASADAALRRLARL